MIPSTDISDSHQAELALVGGLMVPHRGNEYHAVRETLAPGDIESNAARLVFEAIGEVLAAGAVVDMEGIAVKDALQKRRVKTMTGETDGFTAIGGATFFYDLASAAGFDSNGLSKIVLRHATARKVRAAGDELHRLAGQGLDTSDMIAGAETIVGEIAGSRLAGGAPVQLADIVRAQAAIVQAPLERGLLGIPTGSRRMDRLTHGFLPGKVYVIVGRPGSGKSAKAWHHGFAAASAGYWAHMFSLEMPEEEIATRALANLADIDTYALMRHGPFSYLEENNIRQATEFASVPFTFDCDLFNFERILSRARRLAKDGCRLLIFDYLLLFETAKKFERDELKLAYFTRNLKQLAKQCKVPIICLTQYKKEGEESHPNLEHIYGAAAIRNDADLIELLFSPVKIGEVHRMLRYYDTETERYELMSSIIAKHRGGATGRLNYMFIKNKAKYSDFEGEIRDSKNEIIQRGEA